MNPEDTFYNLSGPAGGGMAFPAVLLAATYILIMSERINRAVIALLAGGAAVALDRKSTRLNSSH